MGLETRSGEQFGKLVRHTNSTGVPQAVVDGRETATMLRVGNLSKQHGASNLSQTTSESHHNTTAHKGVDILSSSLEDGAHNHDNATNNDGHFSAEVIGK